MVSGKIAGDSLLDSLSLLKYQSSAAFINTHGETRKNKYSFSIKREEKIVQPGGIEPALTLSEKLAALVVHSLLFEQHVTNKRLRRPPHLLVRRVDAPCDNVHLKTHLLSSISLITLVFYYKIKETLYSEYFGV